MSHQQTTVSMLIAANYQQYVDYVVYYISEHPFFKNNPKFPPESIKQIAIFFIHEAQKTCSTPEELNSYLQIIPKKAEEYYRPQLDASTHRQQPKTTPTSQPQQQQAQPELKQETSTTHVQPSTAPPDQKQQVKTSTTPQSSPQPAQSPSQQPNVAESISYESLTSPELIKKEFWRVFFTLKKRKVGNVDLIVHLYEEFKKLSPQIQSWIHKVTETPDNGDLLAELQDIDNKFKRLIKFVKDCFLSIHEHYHKYMEVLKELDPKERESKAFNNLVEKSPVETSKEKIKLLTQMEVILTTEKDKLTKFSGKYEKKLEEIQRVKQEAQEFLKSLSDPKKKLENDQRLSQIFDKVKKHIHVPTFDDLLEESSEKRKMDQIEEELPSKSRKFENGSLENEVRRTRLFSAFLKSLLHRQYYDSLSFMNFISQFTNSLKQHLKIENGSNLDASIDLDIRHYTKQELEATNQAEEESSTGVVSSPASLSSMRSTSESSMATNLTDLQSLSIFQSEGFVENSVNYVIEVAISIHLSRRFNQKETERTSAQSSSSVDLLLCPPLRIFVNFHPESNSIQIMDPGVDFNLDNASIFPSKQNSLIIPTTEFLPTAHYSLLSNTLFQAVKQAIIKTCMNGTVQPSENQILSLIHAYVQTSTQALDAINVGI
ncbi:hypothetical protein C9374_003339 [Naegleria lovaniensis]|uniref:Uncharacterized protein n=1 Tax=Naegleria lovaniensis TaxID=51637 RepID=A0AA88KL65_NAELO|nr:uncharacterized protein C9374_003339 [Naegleria lovaniensis]KAG2385524.1 hypothetical protein C9374_003339 [Naegleria lovaniensis]